MAKTIGVFMGPPNLQSVFGRNVPNRRNYASFKNLLEDLEGGELDGVVIPQKMLPAKMPVTQSVNSFVYIKPSMEVRDTRREKRLAARREARKTDISMRCSSFAP